MSNLKLHTARFFAFVVAIQILNLSIYTQDFRPLAQHNHTVGDFNEINSIVEYVAEVVLDNKNALPEYQRTNNNHKDLQLHKHLAIKIIDLKQYIPFRVPEIQQHNFTSQFKQDYAYQYFKEINPPPPKNLC
ncbi:hypothetical protein [Deminuibacter soli]|nr:hypothetical protein [Deminuibacter soli]